MELFIELLLLFANVIPAFLIAAFMHEAGHVIAGLLNGWRFILISAGPICISRNGINDRIRISFNKDLMYWFGLSVTLPAEIKGEEAGIFGKVLIGGPIGSFVFGALMAGVFALTRIDLFIYTAMIAGAQGLMCIIPMKMRSGAVHNDGTRYMRIRKGGKEAEEEKAGFLIVAQKFVDPDSDYDEDLARTLTNSEDSATSYGGYYYLYCNAKANKDQDGMEKIGKKLEQVGKDVPDSVKKMYAAE